MADMVHKPAVAEHFLTAKIPCHGHQRMMQGNGLNEFGNRVGAHARIRTGDLFLTKNTLCSLAQKQPVGWQK